MMTNENARRTPCVLRWVDCRDLKISSTFWDLRSRSTGFFYKSVVECNFEKCFTGIKEGFFFSSPLSFSFKDNKNKSGKLIRIIHFIALETEST